MAEREAGYYRWLNTLVLVGFGWLAVLAELAPLGGRATSTPSPDLLFCVAAFLVLRRPSSTPAIIVLILGLARDVIGGGVAGVGALALWLSIEALRAYGPWLQRRSFLFEVGAIALLSIATGAFHVVMMTITFAPSPALETLGLGVLTTAAAYVAIAAMFRFVLRLKADPSETRTAVRNIR